MRTLCGWGRRAQTLFARDGEAGRGGGAPVAVVRPLAGGRAPLLTHHLGLQSRGGVKLDQVDGTTCGSAVLVALAAWADPAELRLLEGEAAGVASLAASGTDGGVGVPGGFGARYDARQRQVHRESTRFWPQALGTSPWGMVGWLRHNVPGAGPYRVRLVDDLSPTDVTAAVDAVHTALGGGRPVPLLVGDFVPRHYCLALARAGADRWRVYEPTSGEVRELPLELFRRRALAPALGFDRWQAALLPRS